jgi:TM2 domain-containing membrane protein YozV
LPEILMETERVWVLEDPDERPRPRKIGAGSAHPRPQPHPGVAFSWSMLIWGGGQIYNRQGRAGALLILLMVNFYLDPALLWIYRDPLFTFIRGLAITPSQMLGTVIVCYFLGVFTWLASAERAYYRAWTTRTEAFQGIASAWLPAGCSLIIPGWGQFLNGQPEKGALFLLSALLGFLAVPTALIIVLFWPALELAGERLFWERTLAATILLSALVLLVWPFSWFDALKVSLDDTKKEPVLKRIEYANNRRRMFGWRRGVFPFFKQTVMFALFLVLCTAVAYSAFPRDYYVTRLQRLQIQLSDQHMVLIPQLIGRLLRHP